jgi:hypothetical protein
LAATVKSIPRVRITIIWAEAMIIRMALSVMMESTVRKARKEGEAVPTARKKSPVKRINCPSREPMKVRAKTMLFYLIFIHDDLFETI